MHPKPLAAVTLAVALALGTPGLASAHKPHKAHHGPSMKKARARYLAIVGPVNSAGTTFESAVKAAGTTLTGTELGTDAAPFEKAVETATHKLTTYHWPKRARADVRSLIVSLGTLEGDLASAGNVNALSASSWAGQFSRDDATAGTDAGLVRADLGLHQAK